MLGARQSDVFFGERESGKDVRQNNATAVQAVANIVKSSLGPVGLDKVRLCSRSAILIFDFSIFFFSLLLPPPFCEEVNAFSLLRVMSIACSRALVSLSLSLCVCVSSSSSSSWSLSLSSSRGTR